MYCPNLRFTSFAWVFFFSIFFVEFRVARKRRNHDHIERGRGGEEKKGLGGQKEVEERTPLLSYFNCRSSLALQILPFPNSHAKAHAVLFPAQKKRINKTFKGICAPPPPQAVEWREGGGDLFPHPHADALPRAVVFPSSSSSSSSSYFPTFFSLPPYPFNVIRRQPSLSDLAKDSPSSSLFPLQLPPFCFSVRDLPQRKTQKIADKHKKSHYFFKMGWNWVLKIGESCSYAFCDLCEEEAEVLSPPSSSLSIRPEIGKSAFSPLPRPQPDWLAAPHPFFSRLFFAAAGNRESAGFSWIKGVVREKRLYVGGKNVWEVYGFASSPRRRRRRKIEFGAGGKFACMETQMAFFSLLVCGRVFVQALASYPKGGGGYIG